MKENKNALEQQINQYYKSIVESKNKDKFRQLLKAINKMPIHAPFNNYLVFMQEPNASYYATKEQWERMFDGKVKAEAKPLIILKIFGPVDFVFDVDDVSVDRNKIDEYIKWWSASCKQNLNYYIQQLINALPKMGLELATSPASNFFSQDPLWRFNKTDYFTVQGYATRSLINNKRKIILHPKYGSKFSNKAEEILILFHEIAHHLLGHLGDYKVKKIIKSTEGKKIEKTILSIQPSNTHEHAMQEIEAQLIAILLANRLEIENYGDLYLASWTKEDRPWNIDIFRILKTMNLLLGVMKIQKTAQSFNI